MGWFIAPTDNPELPFAVIDGKGSVAGTHSSRTGASAQMSTLNYYGADPDADKAADDAAARAAAKHADHEHTPVKPPRPAPPPVAFSRSQTQAW